MSGIFNVDMTVAPLATDEIDFTIDRQIAAGLAEYKTMLKAFNGRNVWRDLMAEQIDGIFYSTQMMMEFATLAAVACQLREVTLGLVSIAEYHGEDADDVRALIGELDACIERSGFITSIASLSRNAEKTTSQG